MSKTDNQVHDKQDSPHLLTVKGVADELNESPHVIRNWLKDLKAHIPTEKGSNKYNYFDKEGIKKLSQIQSMFREQGYSIKQIDYYLATGEDPLKIESIPPQEKNELLQKIDGIEESLKQQQEFYKALLDKFDKQQQYIDNSIKVRDERLLEHLNNLQQAKLETAATKEKGFLSRFFKKNK